MNSVLIPVFGAVVYRIASQEKYMEDIYSSFSNVRAVVPRLDHEIQGVEKTKETFATCSSDPGLTAIAPLRRFHRHIIRVPPICSRAYPRNSLLTLRSCRFT